MKRLLIATTALTALAASSAFAADIPARSYTKAPAMLPVYNWTGFYMGVNLGGAWTSDLTGADTAGVIGGAQIGYNWQGLGSPWVLGLEADFQGSSQSESVTVGAVTANAKLPWFGTVRGRVGYAWDRVMIYGTGGFAYQHLQASATIPGVTISGSDTGFGYTVGGGLEWGFADRWSAKFEYLYINTDAGVFAGRVDNNVGRAGVNYRF